MLIFYSGAICWVSLYKTLTYLRRPKTLSYLEFGSALFLVSSFLLSFAGLINPQIRRGTVKKPGIFGVRLKGWKTPLSNFLAHLLFAFSIARERH